MTFGSGFVFGLVCGVLLMGCFAAIAVIVDKIREMFGNE